MNDTLAKRPASFMRAQTQQVRDHISATARLTDQYFAGLKRLEAQYFDGIRRITEAMAAEQQEEHATTPTSPAAEPAAAAPAAQPTA